MAMVDQPERISKIWDWAREPLVYRDLPRDTGELTRLDLDDKAPKNNR